MCILILLFLIKCAVADRTGHAMLHTLYQRNVKNNTQFFIEWSTLDLIKSNDDEVLGVIAYEMATGQLALLQLSTLGRFPQLAK